jgi:glutathione S-transferase
MAITIHGICASPFVRKVFIVAETLNLEFDNIVVTPVSKPEGFNEISPLGKFPVLSDGDLHLAESSVICDYLVNKYGNGEFYPKDPTLRAKALWFEQYANSVLPGVLATVFYERLLKPMLKNEPTDEVRVQDIIENQMPPVFDYLESELPQSGYLLGDELTIGDISVATHFVNASYAKLGVDADKWPKLAAYVAKVLALPSFTKRMTQDAQIFAAKTA